MDKANQIIGSEMSKETVDFLKIQRALIEFAQQVGAERIGVLHFRFIPSRALMWCLCQRI